MITNTIRLSFVLVAAIAVISSCGGGHDHASEEGSNVEKHHIGAEESQEFMTTGSQIVNDAQAHFKTNLMNAMNEMGPVGAISFCNLEADSITNSISHKHGVLVKRVSAKNRNPANVASNNENVILASFQEKLNNGDIPSASLLTSIDGRSTYYAPIIVGAPCLNCHGKTEQMLPELVATIDSRYPNDKAKGYSAGDLRGAWVVDFVKEND